MARGERAFSYRIYSKLSAHFIKTLELEEQVLGVLG
jgi:hypothetical protein